MGFSDLVKHVEIVQMMIVSVFEWILLVVN